MAGLSSHTRPESDGLDSGAAWGCTPVWSTMHTGKTSHHHTHSGHLPPFSSVVEQTGDIAKHFVICTELFKTIKWMSTATLQYVIISFHRRLRIGKLYYYIISDKGTDNNQSCPLILHVTCWHVSHKVNEAWDVSLHTRPPGPDSKIGTRPGVHVYK
jgi:hypothetical protein